MGILFCFEIPTNTAGLPQPMSPKSLFITSVKHRPIMIKEGIHGYDWLEVLQRKDGNGRGYIQRASRNYPLPTRTAPALISRTPCGDDRYSRDTTIPDHPTTFCTKKSVVRSDRATFPNRPASHMRPKSETSCPRRYMCRACGLELGSCR